MSRIQKNTALFAGAIVLTFIAMYVQLMLVGWGTTASTAIAGGFAAFTLLLGLLVYGIQHQRHKAAFQHKQKATDNTDVKQSRTVEIDLPLSDAFDLALDALHSLDGEYIPKTLLGIRSRQILKIHHTDRDIGHIKAGLRAKTIGIPDIVDFSRIEIHLQRIDDHTTRLRIDSQPTNPLEVYDMARHTHYVNHLAVYLRRESDLQRASTRLEDEFIVDDGVDSDSPPQADRRRNT